MCGAGRATAYTEKPDVEETFHSLGITDRFDGSRAALLRGCLGVPPVAALGCLLWCCLPVLLLLCLGCRGAPLYLPVCVAPGVC